MAVLLGRRAKLGVFCPDRRNLVCGETTLRVGMVSVGPAVPALVLLVVGNRAPSQVVSTVVGDVTVTMPCDLPWKGGAVPHGQNQPVQLYLPTGECDDAVAFPICIGLQNCPCLLAKDLTVMGHEVGSMPFPIAGGRCVNLAGFVGQNSTDHRPIDAQCSRDLLLGRPGFGCHANDLVSKFPGLAHAIFSLVCRYIIASCHGGNNNQAQQHLELCPEFREPAGMAPGGAGALVPAAPAGGGGLPAVPARRVVAAQRVEVAPAGGAGADLRPHGAAERGHATVRHRAQPTAS